MAPPELELVMSPLLGPIRSRGTRSAQTAPPENLADELQKLADLRAADVLTDEEFQRAKAKLLGS
jgi:hypothetical protein